MAMSSKFLVTTGLGLENLLAEELVELGGKNPKAVRGGVLFEHPWRGLRQLMEQTRLGHRFLKPVLEFEAYNQDDLYHAIYKRHDFTKYIDPEETLAVEAHVRDHKQLRDQRFVAMKVKDAVVDQFQKKFGRRPSVELEKPDLRIIVRFVGPKADVSVDLTGASLSHRGYRLEIGEAPLRETLAAGLLRLSGWNQEDLIVDPMCGAGTILIEAALMLKGGLHVERRTFPFEAFKFLRDLNKEPLPPPNPTASLYGPVQLFGFDENPQVIAKAKRNARRAGVESLIHFETSPLRFLQRPKGSARGLVITNPPYAVRMGTPARLQETYSQLSELLKDHFKGWDLWLISGDAELTRHLKLKAQRRYPVKNGTIDCRILHYPVGD